MRRRAFSYSSAAAFLFLLASPAGAAEPALLVPQKVAAAVVDADGDGLADASEALLGTDAGRNDSDGDGVADGDEVRLLHTDPRVADTDGDGFEDGDELARGFSPLHAKKRLADVDSDADGLSDALEFAFGTDTGSADTDGDGFSDAKEIDTGYSPRDVSPVQLEKSISIHTKSQKLRYFLDGVLLGEYSVSTGKRSTPTPTGDFVISGKHPRAWSNRYKLWMPWWSNFTGPGAPRGQYGIHELPIWPGGRREGANHLGVAVSGGCVRLGVGAAKFVYDWAPVGTKVTVRAD